jgi:hypothetical protein
LFISLMSNASMGMSNAGATTKTGGTGELVHGVPPPSSAATALEVLTGMAAGAIAGTIAGPPGIIVGAMLGGAVGAAASIALDAQREEEHIKDEALDRAIGVIDGSIGAAPPNQPAATRGTFSPTAMGLACQTEVHPSEGPMQNVDSD